MLEVVAALFVLAVAISLLGEMVAVSKHGKRQVQRQWAQREVSAAMLQLVSQPFDQLSSTSPCSLSPAAAQQYPDAELKLSILKVDNPLPAKRLTLELHWGNTSTHLLPPTRLTAWVYPPGETP